MLSPSHLHLCRDLFDFDLQVSAALFEPPPFQPSKLSVQYLPGATASSWNSSRGSNGSSASMLTTSSSSTGWCQTPTTRCYTLTHNDVTGALQLSIGADYNQRQVQGFYTRILRDEITAEWYFTAAGSPAGAGLPAAGSAAASANGSGAAAGAAAAVPAELHIYCHVSGEERWLAPPQLRNFIFRREMSLVSGSGSSSSRCSICSLLFAIMQHHAEGHIVLPWRMWRSTRQLPAAELWLMQPASAAARSISQLELQQVISWLV